ncbi:Molecular chaperone IbpA, HSP20 family [Sinosporangium album]|uniref:Molecular chaperone IbpA, HSP20 family n=1 Tax=Sinosporangium album TaxID=504805 RepID=A0A1G8BNQ3_9ACTN|nr:Hsp20/alpha crystallin family protein [Sinosporangium album]SDH34855.1 Molecular chaperone IbpA, HSP20 family [Sinosporangium album]
MRSMTRRESRGVIPDILERLEAPFAGRRPMAGQAIRFEEHVQDGRYILRAELPGIDPERDVEVTVANGVLTIRAERQEEVTEHHRTEFRYGSFSRSVRLPAGADESDVTAVYDKGILEINIRISETKQTGRRIPVERTA